MIKLYDLLTEQIGKKPKAIILAGAPGAGKGTVLKDLNLDGLKILNVDNIYIEKLKQANISLDLKNATPEERSEQAKLMAASNSDFSADVCLYEAAVPSNTNDSLPSIVAAKSPLNSLLEAAISFACSLLSSGVAFFKSNDILACFSFSM